MPLIIKNYMATMGFAAQNVNAVDSNFRVQGCDLKGFIASTTPVDAIQPFRSHSCTLKLENGTVRLE